MRLKNRKLLNKKKLNMNCSRANIKILSIDFFLKNYLGSKTISISINKQLNSTKMNIKIY